jgi:hypothetical protein
MISVGSLNHMRVLEKLVGMNRGDIKKLADTAGNYYRQFDSNRIGTEKWRHIDNPVNPLKVVQKRIQKGLLVHFHFPETMFGGISGRSAIENAQQHVGKSLVVTLDLKSCFPKTKSGQVLSVYKKYFHATDHIAILLTKLTTFRGLLPQGAATSSSLANLALLEMHNEILTITAGFGLGFSMFVDDLALSGDKAREAIGPVIKVIQKHGHGIGNKKKRIMPKFDQQIVTGKLVNTKVSIQKKKINGTAKAIIALANRKSITLRQMQSVMSRIGAVKALSPGKGVLLERLASKLLPVVQGKGFKTVKEIRRICRNRNCLAIHARKK